MEKEGREPAGVGSGGSRSRDGGAAASGGGVRCQATHALRWPSPCTPCQRAPQNHLNMQRIWRVALSAPSVVKKELIMMPADGVVGAWGGEGAQGGHGRQCEGRSVRPTVDRRGPCQDARRPAAARRYRQARGAHGSRRQRSKVLPRTRGSARGVGQLVLQDQHAAQRHQHEDACGAGAWTAAALSGARMRRAGGLPSSASARDWQGMPGRRTAKQPGSQVRLLLPSHQRHRCRGSRA